MDSLDKLVFSHPCMVRDLLRLLPGSLAAEFDLRTLRRLPASYVGAGLRQRHADLPFFVRYRRRAGHPPWACVLVLLEFQTTVERHMALRFDAYAALLRQDLLRQGSLIGPGGELPRVLAVLVHRGRRRWTAPTGLLDLTGPGARALAPLQPAIRYVALDESRRREDDCPAGNAAAVLSAVHNSAEPAAAARLLARLFRLLPPGERALRREIHRWVVDELLADRFGGRVALALDAMEDEDVLAERMKEWRRDLLREGMAAGRREGMAAGRQEGMAAGRREALVQQREMLCRQATARFGSRTGRAIAPLLADVGDPHRLAQAGDWVVCCASSAELLERLRNGAATD